MATPNEMDINELLSMVEFPSEKNSKKIKHLDVDGNELHFLSVLCQ